MTAAGDVVFVVNPASGNGSTGRRWPEIFERAVQAGLRGEALLSQRPGGVVELARRAAESSARLVVVVGGDGTVNEAVNGVLAADRSDPVELAVIPRGTGADFARNLRIPTSLDAAVSVAASGRPRTIDAGRVEYLGWDGSREDRYFANHASAGMSGAIARRANAGSKAFGGKLSFLWATVAVFVRWRNAEVRVDVDGERREGRMHAVVAANGASLAGGMRICPDARPDDGLLDVLLIGDVTKADLVRTLPKIYRGTHLPHPRAELLRGRRIAADAAVPLPVELDGEQPGTTPVTFEVVPGALRVRVPA